MYIYLYVYKTFILDFVCQYFVELNVNVEEWKVIMNSYLWQTVTISEQIKLFAVIHLKGH